MERGRGDVEYEDLAVGDGEVASRGADVEIRYSLVLNRGELVEAERLYQFRLGERRVVAGLEYGVEGMRVGGQRRIRVGPHLAYRDQRVSSAIPPNAVLEFRVELLRVANGNP